MLACGIYCAVNLIISPHPKLLKDPGVSEAHFRMTVTFHQNKHVIESGTKNLSAQYSSNSEQELLILGLLKTAKSGRFTIQS